MKLTHLLAAALITALILACFAAPAAALDGSGTEADPYLISSLSDLQSFRDSVDAGTSTVGKYWKLTADIDMGGSANNWNPIGSSTYPFNGNFDGDGHILSNLYVSNNGPVVALFHTGTATYSNLGLTNVQLVRTTGSADTMLSALAASFNGGTHIVTINNCFAEITSVSVTGNNNDNSGIYLFGGLFMNRGGTVAGSSITDSYVDVRSITFTNSPFLHAVYGLGTASVHNSYTIIGTESGTKTGNNKWSNFGCIAFGNSYSDVVNSVALSGAFSDTTTSLAALQFVRVGNVKSVTNTYASSAITYNGKTYSGTTTDKNGLSISSTEWLDSDWWDNTVGFDFNNVWYWDETATWEDSDGNVFTGRPLLQVFRSSIPPTISAISATPATGGQSTEYTLSVTATTEAAGGIASYQWYYSTNSGNTWQPISGANTASYVWQLGQSISGDVLLKCLVTGADGGETDSYEAGYTNIKITVITPPAISSISVSRPLQKVNAPTTLTAIFADTQTASYQWYYSTNGGTTWQAISGATQTTAQYTPTTTGTHSIKIIATNQFGESSELSTTITVLSTYTPTPITQTTFDFSIDSSAKYQGIQQFTLSAELNAINYYTPDLAHLAHDNALYYLDSAEQEVIPVSNTTGGTISAAYLGQYTGVITDTAGNTAFYSYQSNDWQYIEQNNAQIIASTSSYAATVSGGTLRIYNLNGNLVASTATTAANLAGNDQTNVFVSYSGATITYYWYQDNEIKTASKTLPHTITELHQISTTSNWLISTTANTYTVSISDTGSYELLSTTDTDTPLIHTQATSINVLIGVAEPNEIFIVGADGETDGTYVTGSTLNDASIAKATGLFAITGGEDRQVYILAKSTSSTWQLLQTISFGAAIDHSQISTTGTYAAVSTGLKLYLLEAVDISANTYLLQGVIIGSSGSVWANKPFTINGDNLRTDANGRFVYSVQPSTLYTIVTDTTTTEYTATNAALQQIAIKLKPNPFAQSVSYSTDYNADTRNFEMIYTDTRDLTSSVTWVIRETGNQTIVSTQTVQAGQTAYWEVPLDKSFTSYQISMIADRQGTNVENVWIITPDGKSPINIPGLDETGRTIIFGAVLMIFGGLFGVMHSTKGALLTVALAGVMTYLGLLNIPWVIIMVAGTIAVAAILGKGSGGS